AAAIAVAAGGGDDGSNTASNQPAATTKKKKPKPKAQTTQAETTPAAPAPPASTQATTTPDTETNAAGPSDSGESPGSLNDAGYAKLQAGDAAGATPLLEQAVKGFEQEGSGADRTTYGYALYNLGSAYAATGRYDEAIAMYNRRLQVNPNDR